MTFWLGLHMVAKLGSAGVPVCVSYSVLRDRRRLPAPPGVPVFVDSRGFTEVSSKGRYTFRARDYAAFVRRLVRGGWDVRHASVMDWMCEPDVINGNAKKGWPGTGMTVARHQTLTVNSWLELNSLDATLPWLPVIQGYEADDYHRCADLYLDFAATDLTRLPLVGLGSVCRRQGMAEAAVIVKSLYARGLTNLHGFGFKVTGLVSKGLRLARYLKSADSMAWSRAARDAWKHHGMTLCDCHQRSSANCLAWALAWRESLVRRIESVTSRGTQQLLY